MSMQDIKLELEEGRVEITDQFGGKLEIFMHPKHDGITIRMPGAENGLNLSREQIMRIFPHIRALYEVQVEWGKIHPNSQEGFRSPQ